MCVTHEFSKKKKIYEKINKSSFDTNLLINILKYQIRFEKLFASHPSECPYGNLSLPFLIRKYRKKIYDMLV